MVDVPFERSCIDPRDIGNDAEKVYHFCGPNARQVEESAGVRGGERNLVFIVALEGIKAGTEVSIDYGDDEAEVKIKPNGHRPIMFCDCDSDVRTGVVWRTVDRS